MIAKTEVCLSSWRSWWQVEVGGGEGGEGGRGMRPLCALNFVKMFLIMVPSCKSIMILGHFIRCSIWLLKVNMYQFGWKYFTCQMQTTSNSRKKFIMAYRSTGSRVWKSDMGKWVWRMNYTVLLVSVFEYRRFSQSFCHEIIICFICTLDHADYCSSTNLFGPTFRQFLIYFFGGGGWRGDDISVIIPFD